MTQKEKLVELIEDSINKWDFYLYHFDDERLYNDASEEKKKSFEEFISDYLLENGVIVPPCKLGDTVWMLITCSSTKTIYQEGKRKQEHHQHTYIRSVEMTKLNFFRVIKDIGDTVFLTKEEAEKALAEKRANNG